MRSSAHCCRSRKNLRKSKIMLPEKLSEVVIGFGALAAGLIGSLSLATGGTGADGWLLIFEKGGFLLLTLVGLGLFTWLIIPKFIDWARAYLERLEERNMKQLEMFLGELEKQRLSRELAEGAVREILHDHKVETVAAIKELGKYFERLLSETKNQTHEVKQLQENTQNQS